MRPDILTTLTRFETSDHGTFGVLSFPGFACFTLEPPDKGNARNISCVPRGSYLVKIRISPKYGPVFWVSNVPNRSFILIHSGNFGGAGSAGFKTHTNGCILLGAAVGYLDSQRAVLNSRLTVDEFMGVMDNQDFILNIGGV